MTERVPYRSIFLEADAPHQRHYGWRVADDRPGLRLLQRRYGPFTRSLVLLGAEGMAALEAVMSRLGRNRACAEITVHDFDGVLDVPCEVDGMRLLPLDDRTRLLNAATYVVDLGLDEATLFANLHAQFRRRIRQAREQGFELVMHAPPDPALFDHYYRQQLAFSKRQGFAVAGRRTLEGMFAAADAVLFELRTKDGTAAGYLMAYIAGGTALFLYGVSLRKDNDGAGQLLQWEVILGLKRLGCRWYDMGGVPTDADGDGILGFKKKFGGQYVPLGQELRYVGSLLKVAMRGRALIRGRTP